MVKHLSANNLNPYNKNKKWIEFRLYSTLNNTYPEPIIFLDGDIDKISILNKTKNRSGIYM